MKIIKIHLKEQNKKQHRRENTSLKYLAPKFSFDFGQGEENIKSNETLAQNARFSIRHSSKLKIKQIQNNLNCGPEATSVSSTVTAFPDPPTLVPQNTTHTHL